MKAAVYRGKDEIRYEDVPRPEAGPGEVLVRVRVCGLCQSDIKKIHYGLQAPPRIFGHETTGEVAEVGKGISHLKAGQRVVFHHHVPCLACRYCLAGAYSMCPTYKNVTTTAGFEPAGGGFAEYVLVPPHIAKHGVIPLPDSVAFEAASFVEPLNCVVKALDKARIQAGEWVLVQGAGPMGLLFIQAVAAFGAFAIVTDLIDSRLERAKTLGAAHAFRADDAKLATKVKDVTQGYGVDATMVCVPALPAVHAAFDLTRKGGRVLLFAEFAPETKLSFDPNLIYGREIDLIGSYSSSYKLQQLAADLVFSGRVKTEPLVSHRFPLSELSKAIQLAVHPDPETYKILIAP
ncbi:MAG: alcohol dehydrogenase catalytic domain-containing protein [Bdellovibrionota bacterium]